MTAAVPGRGRGPRDGDDSLRKDAELSITEDDSRRTLGDRQDRRARAQRWAPVPDIQIGTDGSALGDIAANPTPLHERSEQSDPADNYLRSPMLSSWCVLKAGPDLRVQVPSG
jgi:hypothetical protein